MTPLHAVPSLFRAPAPAACLLCVAALALLCGAPSNARAGGEHAANLTVFYPVGTNQDPDIDTHLRLSLLYGRVGSVRGVDLNGGVSLVGRDLQGLQLTGLYSRVGGAFSGLAATGLVGNFASDATGVQLTGLVNVVRGDLTGLQYAGLFNFTAGDVHGVQVTAVFNVSRGEGGFLQLAGVANSHDGDFGGAQLGGVNFVTGRCRGLQLGLGNFAAESRGLQAGLVNLTGHAQGLQLGLVNYSRRHDGLPVGLLNLEAETGGVDWLVFGSNLALAGTGVRTEVGSWYAMTWLGYGDARHDGDKTVFLGWNYGYGVAIDRAWRLGLDLGFVHIIPEKQDDPGINDALHFALQARVLVELRISRQVAAFAGGGLSRLHAAYALGADKETEAHVVAGVALY